MKKAEPKTRPFSQRIAAKIKQLLTRKVLKRVFLIAAFFLVADVVIAALSWTSFGRLSPAVFYSDLLFVEGSFILVIGVFIAVVRAWGEPEPEADESTVENENDASPHFSLQMMFVGAILIALSVTVGTFTMLI